jgi:PPM family protein phosphatase
VRFLPGNAQHIGARRSQQDSFGFADPEDRDFIAHGGFLAIVCDGMGGMEYGDAASRTAVRAFLDGYQRKTPAESIPQALERSAREANAQVVATAQSLGLAGGIGTTLVAAALHDQSLYYISVGDSGVFLWSNGQLRTLNRPHIFANLLDAAVARGSLTREDAANHPERESLTSFIGTENLEEIDRNIEPYAMAPGDTVLLASDGMFKTLNLQEITESLEGAPQSWPESLVARTIAKQREYQDNVTVVSVTLAGEAQALPQTAVLHSPAPPLHAPAAPPPAPVSAMPPVSAAPAMSVAPKKNNSLALWPIVVIVLMLAAGAAGWWYLKYHAGAMKNSPAVNDPARERPAPTNLPPDDTPDPNPKPPMGSSAPATAPSPAPTPAVKQ